MSSTKKQLWRRGGTWTMSALIAGLALATEGCRPRQQSLAETKDEPAPAAPGGDSHALVRAQLDRLTPTQRADLEDRVAALVIVVNETPEEQLFKDYLALSRFVYVKPSAADAAAAPKAYWETSDKASAETTLKLLYYAAVRQRVVATRPQWRIDVYNELFGPRSRTRERLSIDQFRDDSYGARIFSGPSAYAALLGIVSLSTMVYGHSQVAYSNPSLAAPGEFAQLVGGSLLLVSVALELFVVFGPQNVTPSVDDAADEPVAPRPMPVVRQATLVQTRAGVLVIRSSMP